VAFGDILLAEDAGRIDNARGRQQPENDQSQLHNSRSPLYDAECTLSLANFKRPFCRVPAPRFGPQVSQEATGPRMEPFAFHGCSGVSISSFANGALGEHCRHGGARIPSRQQANVQLVSALGAGRVVVFYGGP
jgi:hypothetical protein